MRRQPPGRALPTPRRQAKLPPTKGQTPRSLLLRTICVPGRWAGIVPAAGGQTVPTAAWRWVGAGIRCPRECHAQLRITPASVPWARTAVRCTRPSAGLAITRTEVIASRPAGDVDNLALVAGAGPGAEQLAGTIAEGPGGVGRQVTVLGGGVPGQRVRFRCPHRAWSGSCWRAVGASAGPIPAMASGATGVPA